MGGLTQLIATGAQDIFLTGDPQRSLWKRNSVRKTNFAIESIENTVNLVYETPTVITIAKKGDLVKSCVLQITMMKSSIASFYPVEQFLKSVTVVVGGQDIEIIEDAATWLRIRDETFNDVEIRSANQRMLNFAPDDVAGSVRTFYLDLPLFFTKYLSTALPLVALQYHEVQLRLVFNNPVNIPGIDATYTPTVRFYADYIFLDRPERAYFAQNPHEYMIEQLQIFKANPIINPTITSQTVTLPFNHPVRYIMWVYQSNLHGIYTTGKTPFETNDAYAPLNEARIQANGVDRFTARPGSYFNLVQPTQAVSQAPSAGIYMYSFGVMANDQDSAGTLNFSQLDTVTLHLTAKAASASTIAQVLTPDVTLDTALNKFNMIAIFAVNYNVFRVMDGMSGVMWSN